MASFVVLTPPDSDGPDDQDRADPGRVCLAGADLPVDLDIVVPPLVRRSAMLLLVSIAIALAIAQFPGQSFVLTARRCSFRPLWHWRAMAGALPRRNGRDGPVKVSLRPTTMRLRKKSSLRNPERQVSKPAPVHSRLQRQRPRPVMHAGTSAGSRPLV